MNLNKVELDFLKKSRRRFIRNIILPAGTILFIISMLTIALVIISEGQRDLAEANQGLADQTRSANNRLIQANSNQIEIWKREITERDRIKGLAIAAERYLDTVDLKNDITALEDSIKNKNIEIQKLKEENKKLPSN